MNSLGCDPIVMFRPLVLALLVTSSLHAESPFRVPQGFTITRFAGDDLTNDTWAMTISNDGRVAVSGPGYIKVLLDTDKDGVADRAEVVSDKARNPHGLLWHGNDLLSVQPQGIFLHRSRTDNGLPGGAPELFYKLPGGGGEHGPHGIRRGPDGWFYVACGNNTNIGFLNMQTESLRGVARANNFTVARLRRDLPNRSSIGGMFVNRTSTSPSET